MPGLTNWDKTRAPKKVLPLETAFRFRIKIPFKYSEKPF